MSNKKPSLGPASVPGWVPESSLAWKIALAYALLSALWILLSGRLLLGLVTDKASLERLEMLKGWGFVLVTGVLLGLALQRYFARIRVAGCQAQEAARFASALVNGLSAQIVVVDEQGVIVAVNEAWRRFVSENGVPLENGGFGVSYFTVCPAVYGPDAAVAVAVAKGVREVLAGGRASFELEFPGHTPHAERWFNARVTSFEEGPERRAIIVHEQITERKRAEMALRKSERQLRALSRRLEWEIEEERTRISREIHDELGQMLTGIKMDLGTIEQDLDAFGNDPRVSPVVERLVAAMELTDTTIKTVQRIAAELRPGILDKLGLEMALQVEVDQFQKRSGLPCRLVLPESPQKLDAKVTTVFFRICQEALTNVIRHAQASAVEVALRTDGDCLELDVRDNGRGFAGADLLSPESLGLLGMQERAHQVGGTVTFITPPDGGTLVALRVPKTPSPAERT